MANAHPGPHPNVKGFAHFRYHWKRRVLLFTPSWFSINMGTGITSILLYNLPYQFNGLHIIADVIFGLNVLLFVFFLFMSIARYAIWPSMFKQMLLHPQQSLFLGTFPMGFSTILNMIVFACVPNFTPQSHWIYLAWGLWWVNVVLAVTISIGVPFVMFVSHETHDLASMNATWILPSVSCIVASATGAIIAGVIPNQAHVKLTLVVAYMLWGTGFAPAVLIMALYFQRLVVYHTPPNTLIVSSFLPLGPCGQGSFAILRLANVIRSLSQTLPATSMYTAAELHTFGSAIYAISIPTALVIWGFGFFWLVVAIGSVIKASSRENLGFNMGWWGFTFPLGVFTTATVQLATEFNSGAFKVLGTFLSLSETILWAFVAVMTLKGFLNDALFVSPDLSEEDEMHLLGPNEKSTGDVESGASHERQPPRHRGFRGRSADRCQHERRSGS